MFGVQDQKPYLIYSGRNLQWIWQLIHRDVGVKRDEP